MTSYEFEIAAKNAVINEMKNYGVEINISELELIWFSCVLGNKTCVIWGGPMGFKHAEVTYNQEKDEMGISIFQVVSNKKIPASEFDFSATKENN